VLPNFAHGMTEKPPSNIKCNGEIFLTSWRALKCTAHKRGEERALENERKLSLDNRAQKTRHFSRRKSAAIKL
jgi:hypothetical protein